MSRKTSAQTRINAALACAIYDPGAGREQIPIPGSDQTIDIASRLPRARSPVLQALEMLG